MFTRLYTHCVDMIPETPKWIDFWLLGENRGLVLLAGFILLSFFCKWWTTQLLKLILSYSYSQGYKLLTIGGMSHQVVTRLSVIPSVWGDDSDDDDDDDDDDLDVEIAWKRWIWIVEWIFSQPGGWQDMMIYMMLDVEDRWGNPLI